jgi:hypothetical protein
MCLTWKHCKISIQEEQGLLSLWDTRGDWHLPNHCHTPILEGGCIFQINWYMMI